MTIWSRMGTIACPTRSSEQSAPTEPGLDVVAVPGDFFALDSQGRTDRRAGRPPPDADPAPGESPRKRAARLVGGQLGSAADEEVLDDLAVIQDNDA